MILPPYRFGMFIGFLFLTIRIPVSGQNPTLEEILPGLREQAIIMDIAARIVEENQEIVWNSENSKVTISGRPVGIKLVGDNVVVAVQFTPYFRSRGNNFLVAQGQVWIDIPNKGISYYTSIQTIPMEFEETIYFFPLGPGDSQEEARIEIQLMLRPYISNSAEVEQSNPSPP